MRRLKILSKRDECCAETKLIVVVGEIARKTENPLWSKTTSCHSPRQENLLIERTKPTTKLI
jgi:hypothetical protein